MGLQLEQKRKPAGNKNYMSIGASVRTTKFAARNNSRGVRSRVLGTIPNCIYLCTLAATIRAGQMTVSQYLTALFTFRLSVLLDRQFRREYLNSTRQIII
jgi:hypothetical protein